MPAHEMEGMKRIFYILNYLKRSFLDLGVRLKLLNAIPVYTKHGFHTGLQAIMSIDKMC